MITSETQVRPRTRSELLAALPEIESAPKDAGPLELIAVRPQQGIRRCPETVTLSAERGIEGDHWARGCWKVDAEGLPDRQVQVSLMPVRSIRAIAGGIENWAIAGNNLYVDLDLTPANAAPGTRLALGSAVIEISPEPNFGCDRFIERFGRDACVFVNTGIGRAMSLRGAYARVIRDGMVRVGDIVRKVAES